MKGKISIEVLLKLALGVMVLVLIFAFVSEWLPRLAEQFINQYQ